MNDSIGQKLRILRKERRMTQQELADALGVKRATISNYEIERRSPHLSELRRIAEFFGVGLDYFGMVQTDDILDLVARAKKVFDNESIPTEKKEAVYKELMKLYLNLSNGDDKK